MSRVRGTETGISLSSLVQPCFGPRLVESRLYFGGELLAAGAARNVAALRSCCATKELQRSSGWLQTCSPTAPRHAHRRRGRQDGSSRRPPAHPDKHHTGDSHRRRRLNLLELVDGRDAVAVLRRLAAVFQRPGPHAKAAARPKEPPTPGFRVAGGVGGAGGAKSLRRPPTVWMCQRVA